jgi:hypothetical protein
MNRSGCINSGSSVITSVAHPQTYAHLHPFCLHIYVLSPPHSLISISILILLDKQGDNTKPRDKIQLLLVVRAGHICDTISSHDKQSYQSPSTLLSQNRLVLLVAAKVLTGLG